MLNTRRPVALLCRNFAIIVIFIFDSDVTYYQVFDQTSACIGGIYFDLFERDNKDPDAWMAEGRHRRALHDGKVQLPIAYVNCDFKKSHDEKTPPLFFQQNVVDLKM